jgi:hypothetical protein
MLSDTSNGSLRGNSNPEEEKKGSTEEEIKGSTFDAEWKSAAQVVSSRDMAHFSFDHKSPSLVFVSSPALGTKSDPGKTAHELILEQDSI